MAQKPAPNSSKKGGGAGSGVKRGAAGSKGGSASVKGSATRRPSAGKSK